MLPSRHGYLMRCTCHRTSLRVWVCGMNRSLRTELQPRRRARTGDLDGARKAIARMQQLRDATKDPKFDYFKNHLDLQMQAASAWVAASEGEKSEAIEMLRRAADAEDILGKHPVSPGAFVPIREQLGSLLLEEGQRSRVANGRRVLRAKRSS